MKRGVLEPSTKSVELERLTMAIHENIVTPEVKANGFGAVDSMRFEHAIDQIAHTYKFKVKLKLRKLSRASRPA